MTTSLTQKALKQKTLEQLRSLARASRLRGWSDLNKQEIVQVLLQHKRQAVPAKTTGKAATTPEAKKPRKSSGKKPAARRAAATTAASTAPVFERIAGDEERVENAKYQMAPPETAVSAQPAPSSTLDEDIETLRLPAEPQLCLLPQKPGVVHAYWVLHPGAPMASLKLRLCRVGGDAIELVAETKISAERGHWYFKIPQSVPPEHFFIQLGYYDAKQKFVSAIGRGIARIPSWYASERTDRRWWVSDEEFNEMYTRAGGVMRDARLLWPGASSSSPFS